MSLSLNYENDINDEWSSFISSTNNNDSSTDDENDSANLQCPKATDIYISTKSKIAYLTEPIDLSIFWKLTLLGNFLGNFFLVNEILEPLYSLSITHT